jgi:hypothetical protein
MRTRIALLPLVVAAGLAGATPAMAAGGHGGEAHLAGGDLPPIIPSIVQTRITRTENALERLNRYADNLDSAKVVTVSKVIRRQTTAAWRGAKYYLKHAPAPPAEDRGVRVRRLHAQAHLSDDAVLPVIADPFTTAIAVFGLAHDVSANAIELTDGAHGNTLSGVNRTLFWTLDKRNAMVADAQALQPPPEPEDRGRAQASQEEGTPDFATLMPEVTQQIDDEIQHVDGLLSDATDLRPRGRTSLGRARAQLVGTEGTINTIWPPVPAED